MSKKYQKLSYKFLLPIFLSLVFVGFALNYEITKSIKHTLLEQASNQVVNFVQLQASRHNIVASDYLLSNPEGIKHFDVLAQEVTTKDVIRVKAWDKNQAVVYSDDTNLIGKTFGANPELKSALTSGYASTEIAKPTAAENVDERNYKEFLEIYVPIIYKGSGSPIGVVEIYYKLNGLDNTLQTTQRNIAVIIAGSLAFLMIVISLLLSIFVLSPIKKLQNATAKISKGDLRHPVVSKSKDELGDLVTSFNHMLVGLQRLQQLKNEFVFIAAHELRAPVTTIKGYLSMLKEKPEDQEVYLEEVDKANQQLEQLVDDLLDIARADAGKLSFSVKPLNLNEVINESIEYFAPSAKEKDIHLEYVKSEQDYIIVADHKRLSEVVANIISNAIKYGNQAGYVSITHEIHEGSVSTHFTDNGMGISEEAKKNMFQKFYRSTEAQAAGIKGTGLGMYITKELVERMGGKISFYSTDQKGTTFVVDFPLAEQKV